MGKVQGKLSRIFKKCIVKMGLQVTAHQLRHSGPHYDRTKNVRTLPEIKKRGRWASDAAVARYSETAMLNAQIAELPSEVGKFCKTSSKNIEGVLAGRLRPSVWP